MTLSRDQAELARERVAEAGLRDRVEIRVSRLPRRRRRAVSTRSARSACSSTSGWRSSASTSARCTSCSRRAAGCSTTASAGRPAGEAPVAGSSRSQLHRALRVPRRRAARGRHRRVARCSNAGFEVRHVESLREHYALTLRHWVAQPRGELGRGRASRRAAAGPGSGASTWRPRRSTSKRGRTQIHQILGVKPDAGASHMPLRPDWGA